MIANEFVTGIMIVIAIISSSCAMPGTRNPKRKLIIDTDAGADDAVAIILALETERLGNGPEIVAITCVNGNADLDDVGRNVLKTLKSVNRLDIPVYKGASHPVVLANKKDYYFGRDGFGDFHYTNPPPEDLIREKHAVIAMIELVQKYRGELTIVTLGPLTNIALAIRMSPSFLNGFHELIIMGGSVAGQGNAGNNLEFNFATDPFANFIVLNSAKSKPPTLIPWETVLRTDVPMKFRNSLSRFDNAKVRLINSAEAVSLDRNAEYWRCADAVAMAVALTTNCKPTVVKSAAYYSDAIYDGKKTSGLIIVDYSNATRNAANVEIVQKINVQVYKDILLKSFSDR